jgi:fucose permease
MMNNQINASRLFLASRIALIATAMTFAIRANLIGTLGTAFTINEKSMGIVFGTAFWGFTLSMIIGGWLCDLLGMKKLLYAAFAGHILGIVLTIFASGFWSLFISTLLIGIANGMVEAACNPLVATLYPDQKTKKLNQFHVWFPGGIVIGGLVAFGLDRIHASWELQIASILIPTIVYGVLFLNQSFPVTERVSSGVSKDDMLKACLTWPFPFMVFCMLITASTELGTNQWITELLSNVGVSSILLLVFINGLMAIVRSFAGEVVHRLSPAGMLLFSAFFSALGLFLLSQTTGYLSFAAAAVFAIGICFFWPTMLGFVSEYIPKSGALGLSIMGGAGMLSVSFILPFIGDLYKIKGGAVTLGYVALLPTFLVFAFGSLYFWQKRKTSEV